MGEARETRHSGDFHAACLPRFEASERRRYADIARVGEKTERKGKREEGKAISDNLAERSLLIIKVVM